MENLKQKQKLKETNKTKMKHDRNCYEEVSVLSSSNITHIQYINTITPFLVINNRKQLLNLRRSIKLQFRLRRRNKMRTITTLIN